MNERLKDEELTAIRERVDKATENYWWAADGVYVITNLETDEDGVASGDFVAECELEEDATFIAYAREDIPKLLTEIIRLRAIADDLLYSSNMNLGEIEEYEKRIRGDNE